MSKCWYYDSCHLDDRENKQEECFKLCDKYRSMKYAMDLSGIPESKQKPIDLYPQQCDLDAFRQLAEIKSNIFDFVKQGKNLLIYSSHTGNGKTSWALKMLMRYIEVNWEGCTYKKYPLCMFVSVPELMFKLKDFNNPNYQKYLEDIANADLVVWDDIGFSNASKFEYEGMLNLISQRLFKEKSNIYTTNLVPEKLEENIGAKLASRMMESTKIGFIGGDRRNG